MGRVLSQEPLKIPDCVEIYSSKSALEIYSGMLGDLI